MIGRLAIFPSRILALLAVTAWGGFQHQPEALARVCGQLTSSRVGLACVTRQSTPQPVQEPAGAASGDVVLASALDKLSLYNTVSASLRQRVGLFGRNLFGSGHYLQQGAGPQRKFRLEMTIQGKRQKHSTTRICDGKLLYLLDDFGGEPLLRFVDLRRVNDALKQADQAQAIDWRRFELGFGGLPRLLASCEENFRFAAASPSQLNDTPVWVLRGHWKPERLQALLAGSAGQGGGKDKPPSQLPPHLPNEVVLYLGRDDLFPYCVEYRAVSAPNQEGTIESQILAAIDFFDVRIDQPVDETQFVGPADLAQTDDTEAFLTRLGIPRTPREIRAEQKK